MSVVLVSAHVAYDKLGKNAGNVSIGSQARNTLRAIFLTLKITKRESGDDMAGDLSARSIEEQSFSKSKPFMGGLPPSRSELVTKSPPNFGQ